MIINRIWAMPNKWTFLIKPIRELILRNFIGEWIDPYAGFNSLAQITNDLNPYAPVLYHLEADKFINLLLTKHGRKFDGAFYDPPYSPRQRKECYKSIGLNHNVGLDLSKGKESKLKNNMSKLIKLGGLVICCGWNSMGFGINRGFEMLEILLVPHGGSHNDTIVTVERKIIER